MVTAYISVYRWEGETPILTHEYTVTGRSAYAIAMNMPVYLGGSFIRVRYV